MKIKGRFASQAILKFYLNKRRIKVYCYISGKMQEELYVVYGRTVIVGLTGNTGTEQSKIIMKLLI